VRLFEVGRTFARNDLAQPLRIGGLAFGSSDPEQWGTPLRAVDVFDVKADIAALAAPLAVASSAASWPWLHPGRSAEIRVDNHVAGWLGELHPRLVRHFELPSAPIVFELEFAAVAARRMPAARAVSRQPSLRRDLAVIVNENIEVNDLIQVLRDLDDTRIEALDVFDVYRGDGLPDGRKSVAILVVMRDTERTLTDVDSDLIVADLLSVLHDRFGATLRAPR
jgi:phenylalanyl-tRNA synthetase beta chain